MITTEIPPLFDRITLEEGSLSSETHPHHKNSIDVAQENVTTLMPPGAVLQILVFPFCSAKQVQSNLRRETFELRRNKFKVEEMKTK